MNYCPANAGDNSINNPKTLCILKSIVGMGFNPFLFNK